MSDTGYDMIRQAAEDLDRKQQRLREIRAELANSSTKVSSTDRMLTVELDGAGELTSITFNSAKFRRLAPAELGAVLVETIKRARVESRQRVLSAYKDLLPVGVREVVNGKPDVDAMFEDARREASEMVANLRRAQAH